jgi:hypothetical protein
MSLYIMSTQSDTSREKYKIYSNESTGHASNIYQMPAILQDNRAPMSIAQIMQRRLSVRNNPADDKSKWMDYFDTSDLLARGFHGEIKLFLTTYNDGSMSELGKVYLSLINPGESLYDGNVSLGYNDRYEKLHGEGVFVTKRENLAEVLYESLSRQQAKKSLFWRVMLRHPDEVPKDFAVPGLLEEVITYIFSEGKRETAMSVNPGPGTNIFQEMLSWGLIEVNKGSHGIAGFGLNETRKSRLSGLDLMSR